MYVAEMRHHRLIIDFLRIQYVATKDILNALSSNVLIEEILMPLNVCTCIICLCRRFITLMHVAFEGILFPFSPVK